MNINEFIHERKGEWDKLERIIAKFRPGRAPELSREELWDLGKLYATAVSDLSLLRSSPLAQDPNNEVIAYLNRLVVRVHGAIYRKQRFTWASAGRFFGVGFPETFRRNAAYVGFAAGIFILFFVAGFWLGVVEPAFIEMIVPERIIATVERGDVWFKDLYTIAPMASSSLMTHNTAVTFLIFASGLTFGIGTIYLLALNGVLLGGIAALCFRHGLSLKLWSFVLPHGSFELTAIVIAGGAALILGRVLVDPGPYRRSELLSVRGKDAGMLVIGCVPLLVVAGILEAFFSPSPLNAWFKIFVAAALFLGLLGYLLTAGTAIPESGPDRGRPHGIIRGLSHETRV